MIAYKVVEVEKVKKLFSSKKILSSFISDGKYKVIYKKDEWVRAPIGGCFLFSTLKEAKTYLSHFYCVNLYYSQIYKCEVIERLPFIDQLFLFHDDSIRYYWRIVKKGNVNLLLKIDDYTGNFPLGTVCYKYVKLIEKVTQ